MSLIFLVSVTKLTLENVFAVPYDHKYPLCTLVPKSNVTLAQPLHLKILYFLHKKAYPDKFQAVAVGERTHNERPTFKMGEAEIGCDETVKLLGLDIDYRLKFDEKISNICRKASQKINGLKRLGKF